MCLCCTHVYAFGYTNPLICKDQSMSAVLLCHSLLYFLEINYLIDHGDPYYLTRVGGYQISAILLSLSLPVTSIHY